MASADRSTLFINATVLDGSEHMEPQPDMAVAVERGLITWMGPSAVAQAPAGAEVIDLAGAYLMPGLINMHVHLCGSGKPVSAGDAGALMKKLDNPVGRAIVRHILKGSAQQQLASGVTTVRGAGDPLFADIAVRNAIDAGKYQGPRLVAPGTGVTVPGGHGAGLFAQVANSPAEAAEQVRDLYARGADVIKLFVTGGVFDATEAAHEVSLPVMAHVESTEGVKAALEAGVDTIEHGAPLTPEILELYRGAAGTQLEGRAPSVTCTISPALPFVLLDPKKTHSTDTQKKNGDIVCSGIIESARAALEAGVKVGLGTDSSCPFVTQYDMWREVAYFAKYVGVSNAFALHTATQVNAELLGLDGETGTIECGKAADILVTRENPLDDLCALREPMHVMCRGDLVCKLKVKRIPEVDAELDAIMAMPAEALAEELARDGVA